MFSARARKTAPGAGALPNRWNEPSANPILGLSKCNSPGGADYWLMGANGLFTTVRAGKLWFGFNDDAILDYPCMGSVQDNTGFVVGELYITRP